MTTKPTLKILHVAETVRGGIATYFNELHQHQAASFGASNIRYIVPADHRVDLVEIDDDSIVGFRRTGRDPGSLWRMTLATIAEVRAQRPDIVHMHSTFAGMVLRPVLKLFAPRTRIIYCPHGWAFSRETSALSHLATKTMERFLAPLCDRIVCISGSEKMAAVAVGIPSAKLALVRSGISAGRSVDPSASWNDARTKVLFVGRLDRQKGYDLLIEAARRLESKVHVRLIGSAVVGSETAMDLPANVEMLGWQSRDAIEAQLDLADVAIIPSRWEGFGLVALEAMRARKPVVAFAIGALPEIVEDGVTGFLCSPVAVEPLAEALDRCTRVPLNEMGENGYERFLRLFLGEQMHRKLSLVYHDVAATSLTENKEQLTSLS